MAVVSPEDFKGAMGSWASGVTVVTTRHDGEVYGITVSSFSSLSMEPRLILVSLQDSNHLPHMIKKSRHFGVSILSLGPIRKAWEAGEAFAASASGHNGLHGRRFELPESFHEKPRQWFEEQAGKLLADGNVKRLIYRGGARLVPADADTAMPTPEEEAAEAETAAPEVAQ